MTTCDAHFRWNHILLDCVNAAGHGGAHAGRWEQSTITWQEGDRRCYYGADPGPCGGACVLPAGHAGNHAV